MELTIDQYLIPNCSLIIDELNIAYKNCSVDEMKKVADKSFSETDMMMRVGYPFKNMARYTTKTEDSDDSGKTNHDIFIENKRFKIELKYLRSWRTQSGTYSCSKGWKEIQYDFNWLLSEINNDNKGKSAFIIAWFNCVDSFSKIIQIGKGKGGKPLVNESKLCFFPFLIRPQFPTRTADLEYNYEIAYQRLQITPIGYKGKECNCTFVGKESDCFHFAIYY